MRVLRTAASLAALLGSLALAPTTARSQATRLTLGHDSTTWVGVSGQLRLRAEGWNGFGAGAPVGAEHDDVFGLGRLLTRGEFHLRSTLAVVAELKSSLGAGRTLPGGLRPSDEDVFDVEQLYGELGAGAARSRVAVRAGRFELLLGRERLVSPLDWANSRRTFQGASARATFGRTDALVFWVRPVIMRQRRADGPDSSRALYGAQLSRTWPGLKAELYWLRTESNLGTFNGTAGPERRHTVGYRINRVPAARRIDADVEMAAQFGTVGGSSVAAWMLGSQVGWTFAGRPAARVYAGFDAASGDRASGGAVQTFSQLFPLGHAFLGYADVHGRQNVVDLSIGTSIKPARDLSLQLDAHDFWRASRADALYAVDGSVSRPAGTGLPSRVGAEVDLTARRALLGGRVALQAGASHYFAGPFLKQSGPGQDINWVYSQVTASF